MNKIIHTDALTGIKSLKPLSVDCVITSPPYFQLRSYITEKHPLKKHEIGLESTPEKYVEALCSILHSLWSKMKTTGTMFVVIGDTHLGGGKTGGKTMLHSWAFETKPKEDLTGWIKRKQLCMIPARFAIRMQELGWILRNQIIWHKPACIPQSITDRFVTDYECIYFFTKTAKGYDFTLQREEYKETMNRWGGEDLKATGKSQWDSGTGQSTYRDRKMRPHADGRIMRSVWSINPKPTDASNTACFPEELVERCMMAGSPIGGLIVDPFMGGGTVASVATLLQRNWIGFEINSKTIKFAESRVALMKAGLTYRRLSTPKFCDSKPRHSLTKAELTQKVLTSRPE